VEKMAGIATKTREEGLAKIAGRKEGGGKLIIKHKAPL
jgi:hypothetical protein